MTLHVSPYSTTAWLIAACVLVSFWPAALILQSLRGFGVIFYVEVLCVIYLYAWVKFDFYMNKHNKLLMGGDNLENSH